MDSTLTMASTHTTSRRARLAAILGAALVVATFPSRMLAADNGVVQADVTVPGAVACLQLSTTTVTFGSAPLGTLDRSAATPVTITNCGVGPASILARGSDATGPGATWILDDTAALCGPVSPPGLALDRYKLRIMVGGTPTHLGLTNKPVETLVGGGSSSHDLRLSTACPGSSGAGQTLSLQVSYLATAL
jgi:hypothetical protein